MDNKFLMNVLAVFVGIAGTGIVLDEAGKGSFGETAANVATKITNGFGV